MKKLTVQEQIENNNQIFQAASKAEKRVLIAQDVINRVKDRQYKPHLGAWVNESNLFEREDNDSLQKVIVDKKVSCACCALGGIMMSCVVFRNKVTVRDYYDDAFEYDKIEIQKRKDITGITSLFSKKQRKLIETAFEEGDGFYDARTKTEKKAVDFGAKYKTPKSRLLAIMQNIIDNNGEFVP